MSKRHYVPTEALDRYAPKVRASLIRRYHALYTKKYRWFVRPFQDQAFYCDGEIPQIDGAEIFDCNWTPDRWHDTPYKYFYNPHQKAWYKSYAREGLPSLSEYGYGYNREDYKVTKNDEFYSYSFPSANNVDSFGYVWWYELNGKRTLKVVLGGLHTYAYDDGTFFQGSFSELGEAKPLKKVDNSAAMTLAKRMNGRKYKGAYEPLINEMIRVFGLNRTQI